MLCVFFDVILWPVMKGLVIKNTGSWYTVRTDDDQLLDCKVKGNFRIKGIKSTNPVAVGDVVTVNDEGWIVDIDDRRNYIIRKSINLSVSWLRPKPTACR